MTALCSRKISPSWSLLFTKWFKQVKKWSMQYKCFLCNSTGMDGTRGKQKPTPESKRKHQRGRVIPAGSSGRWLHQWKMTSSVEDDFSGSGKRKCRGLEDWSFKGIPPSLCFSPNPQLTFPYSHLVLFFLISWFSSHLNNVSLLFLPIQTHQLFKTPL